ncbi:MAG: AbrB/MazE/SpoVT family DNA-binding domain-containing protein [Clostridiales bacterium]|jgi:AbrB family looped-hinge helix DNA binding protein|nr:AbrB/MazE/SpoVT family DNA-binding domain-containing protein [Clostridiales bacterium]
MQTAKLMNGQIKIPLEIRKKMNIKDGDEFIIKTNKNKIEIINPVMSAIEEVQKEFEGVADEMGWKDEQDVVKFIKDMRANRI